MLAAVLAAACAMVIVRFLPYWFLRNSHSPLLAFLQKNMALVIMVVLICYALKPYALAADAATAKLAACALATFALHAWLKSPLVSIVLPTAAYIALVNLA